MVDSLCLTAILETHPNTNQIAVSVQLGEQSAQWSAYIYDLVPATGETVLDQHFAPWF